MVRTMNFDDGSDPAFENVELPDDFVVPKPVRDSASGRFKRKPVGDKADAPAPKRAPRAKTVPNRKGQFLQPLTTLYMGVGGFLMPFDPVCANAILAAAEQCANTWDELAYTNESVRRFLFSLTQVSVTTKLFIAHAPIMMAVMLHHVPAAQQVLGKMGEQMAESIAEQMRGSENKPDAD